MISTECAAMATPNETSDRVTRIQQARDFLKEHPEESITTTSRIFKVTRSTLSGLIHKQPSGRRGSQNRVLTSNQEKCMNQFIRSYLDHNLLPTKGIIMSAITHLHRLDNKPPASNSWFQKWWKSQPLHKIKTKPIVHDRITAQDKGEVQRWFQEYREVIQKYNISRKDIWNFDETRFRVGCPKGQEIYVPLDIKEVSYYYYSTVIRLIYI